MLNCSSPEAQAYSAEPETYVQCGDVIDDIAFFTDGFMDWMFAQKRKKTSLAKSADTFDNPVVPPRSSDRQARSFLVPE
jgi:hypothetical protein